MLVLFNMQRFVDMKSYINTDINHGGGGCVLNKIGIPNYGLGSHGIRPITEAVVTRASYSTDCSGTPAAPHITKGKIF